jgi:hypothetical protein
MVLATSGAIAFSTVNGEFGWGNSMSAYAGRLYYYVSGGVSASGYFPSSNFPMSAFYGKSPDDEWNCACTTDCNCGACGK